jgi:hypothetical protein
MMNPDSYALLPEEAFRHFIAQCRARFNRSRWITFQHAPQNHTLSEQDWLELFATSCTIGQTQTPGGNNAYQMVPK